MSEKTVAVVFPWTIQMKSFACLLLLGDNTSLSHKKKNMAAKSVLSMQIVPYTPILYVCEPIATTLRVVVL